MRRIGGGPRAPSRTSTFAPLPLEAPGLFQGVQDFLSARERQNTERAPQRNRLSLPAGKRFLCLPFTTPQGALTVQ
jgi:hypothetical protein